MPSYFSSSSIAVIWLVFVGVILLQTVNGPNSDLPVYSSQLKEVKRLSQVQLNFLAFASDAGKLLGFLSGVAAQHWPFWLVAFTGAAFNLVVYGIQYLFLDTAGLRFGHMLLLTALAGNGICWTNTVCQILFVSKVVASRNPVAVSLATSYQGLSATVYTSMAEAMPNSKANTYLLLNAVVPMILTLLVAPFLRVVHLKSDSTTDTVLLFMFAIALTNFVVGIISSSTSSALSSSRNHIISLVIPLAMPILIPVVLKIREMWGPKKLENSTVPVVGRADAVIDIAAVETKEDDTVTVAVAVVEVGGLRLLKQPDFWLYFWSYMLSATVGLVFSNNLGQIADSRGLRRTSGLVSLSSSFGFLGRLLPCLVDYLCDKNGYTISRTGSMAWMMPPMAGAYFLLPISTSHAVLYASTAVIATCTGAISSVAVRATSELFGTKQYGINHNLLVANIPVGNLCFGSLASFLYQHAAAEHGRACYGAGCYRVTFAVWGTACLAGTVLCTVLHIRCRVKVHEMPAAAETGIQMCRNDDT